METPYSKLDEVIDQGVTALREQSIDTSEMANVLKPRRRSSVILPVGIATAAACTIGALVLLAPSKADAGEFEKVKKAVKEQPAIYEKVFCRASDQAWEVKAETWRDHDKRGVKVAKAEGVYILAYDGKKKYEKAPDKETFEVELVATTVEDTQGVNLQSTKVVEGSEIVFIDLAWVGTEEETSTINEILARDGTHFLGIKRSQKKDGRPCDIYRVRVGENTDEMLYYVDPKTDLPFLMEVVDANGFVKDKIEVAFPEEIKINVKAGQDGVYEIHPVIGGKITFDKTMVIRGRAIEAKPAKKAGEEEKINP